MVAVYEHAGLVAKLLCWPVADGNSCPSCCGMTTVRVSLADNDTAHGNGHQLDIVQSWAGDLQDAQKS